VCQEIEWICSIAVQFVDVDDWRCHGWLLTVVSRLRWEPDIAEVRD
jgi:hypothetical protein